MFYFGLCVHFTVFEIYKLQTQVMLKLIQLLGHILLVVTWLSDETLWEKAL